MGKVASTRAIDIDCPKGHAKVGEYCNGEGIGVDLCQARINAAVAKTREMNRRAKGKAKCAHERSLVSVDVGRRPIRTCSDCGKRLGTCQNCKGVVELDADGYIAYHSHPPPTRRVCPGSKHSTVEDMEHAAAAATKGRR